MEKRHTHWLNLWNANCDSDKPRPKQELLRDLASWETTQSANSNSYGVTRKDFDGDKWSKGHNDDFKKLIEEAKKQRQAKLNNVVDEPSETANAKDLIAEQPPASAISADPVKQGGFQHAASEKMEETTTEDDDSLYRSRTPPKET